jgi:hypothetical protein
LAMGWFLMSNAAGFRSRMTFLASSISSRCMVVL